MEERVKMKKRMELKRLTNNELSLFESVSQSEVEKYHILQMDRILYPKDIQIYLIVGRQSQIQGMIADYPRWDSIQLVGDPDAIKSVINKVDLNRNEIFFPRELASYFHELVPSPYLLTDHIRFLHNKESHSLTGSQKGQLKKLNEQDITNIQKVLTLTTPEDWGNYIPKFHRNRFWYGLENRNGEFVSVVGGWIECNTSFLIAVATHPQFQRKGFTYTMLSQLLPILYQKSENVLVETTRDNTPACVLYEKLGFIPKYEFMVLHKVPPLIVNLTETKKQNEEYDKSSITYSESIQIEKKKR